MEKSLAISSCFCVTGYRIHGRLGIPLGVVAYRAILAVSELLGNCPHSSGLEYLRISD